EQRAPRRDRLRRESGRGGLARAVRGNPLVQPLVWASTPQVMLCMPVGRFKVQEIDSHGSLSLPSRGASLPPVHPVVTGHFHLLKNTDWLIVVVDRCGGLGGRRSLPGGLRSGGGGGLVGQGAGTLPAVVDPGSVLARDPQLACLAIAGHHLVAQL